MSACEFSLSRLSVSRCTNVASPREEVPTRFGTLQFLEQNSLVCLARVKLQSERTTDPRPLDGGGRRRVRPFFPRRTSTVRPCAAAAAMMFVIV